DRAEQDHRAEYVQEQREVPRVWAEHRDHWPGFQIIRMRISRSVSPDPYESAFPTGSRTSARSSGVIVSPASASRAASTPALVWYLPPRPPSALATTQSTIAAQTQNVPYE